MTVRGVLVLACPSCGTMSYPFFGDELDCACQYPLYTRMIPLSKFPLMVVMRHE